MYEVTQKELEWNAKCFLERSQSVSETKSPNMAPGYLNHKKINKEKNNYVAVNYILPSTLQPL